MVRSKPKIQVTIVIPTHGSAPYLTKVLSGLEAQTYRNFEVIIVDNNKAKQKFDKLPSFDYDLKVIHESRIGLSIARNTGIAYAQGQYVAFLDDDAVPEPIWLDELISGFIRYNTSVIGGAVKLVLPDDLPLWFVPELRIFLAELLYEGKDIPNIDEAKYIVGANMCVKKSIFNLIDGFSASFGRVGRMLRSSEELEFCRRVQKAKYRVSFVYSAQVNHHISPERIQKKYFLSRAYWQGRSDAMLEITHGRPTAFSKRNNWINLKIFFNEIIRFFCLGEESDHFLQQVHIIREYGYFFQYILLTFSIRLFT
jgi:glycosyltransferase involved in cell wall biosynthesis